MVYIVDYMVDSFFNISFSQLLSFKLTVIIHISHFLSSFLHLKLCSSLCM